jgi:hypothetical protein
MKQIYKDRKQKLKELNNPNHEPVKLFDLEGYTEERFKEEWKQRINPDSTECILTIIIHGCLIPRTHLKIPYVTPIKIERRLATDFNTSNYLSEAKVQRILNAAAHRDIKYLNDSINVRDFRPVLQNRTRSREAYENSKYHGVPKTFDVGQPIMNKDFSFDHRFNFLLLTDVNTGLSVNLFKLFTSVFIRLTLSKILALVKDLGYTFCYMYDFSCNNEMALYDNDPEDYKKLGG